MYLAGGDSAAHSDNTIIGKIPAAFSEENCKE